MSIDEIYDLFIWDASYSPEEYEDRERKGIAEASKMQNLYPFIQPTIIPAQKSKSVWEPCAKVIAMRSDEELEPFLHLLLEWLQDMNWPGEDIIFNRLAQMPIQRIEEALAFSKYIAGERNDKFWLAELNALEKQMKEYVDRGK